MIRDGLGRMLEGLRRVFTLVSTQLPAPVRTGIGWGIALATVYAAWVTVIRVVAGGNAFQALGTTWGMTVLSYFAAGGLGGALVGALWRIRGSPLGAVLLGTLALYPIFAWIMYTQDGLNWRERLILAGLLALLVGGVNGFLWWREER